MISGATSPYTIAGLTNDIPYYITVYSTNTKGRDTAGELLTATPKAATLLGITINQNESAPEYMVDYIEDNANFTPAHMDYENDRFDYGSWGDVWFIKGLKPCMLNYDGTVAYELDPNDYTKKKDGTPSDVANPDFPGNAMVGIPKVYYKIVDNGDNTANVYFSNTKLDDGFVCWPHIDSNGDEIPYCYMPIYNGFLSDGKLRSLSGKAPTAKLTAQQEIDYAKANNLSDDVIWCTEVFSDRILINLLLLLIGKSTDTQAVFGTGNCRGGSISYIESSGTMDAKGLFWGNQDDASGVKIFGIEHWWGNLCKRIAGWTSNSLMQKVKLTYGTADGSTVDGYNITGDGYINITSLTQNSSNEGYIDKLYFVNNGIFLPSNISGSASTYYCDKFCYSARSDGYVAVGGVNPKESGALFVIAWFSNSLQHFILCSSPSCKPLAQTQTRGENA